MASIIKDIRYMSTPPRDTLLNQFKTHSRGRTLQAAIDLLNAFGFVNTGDVGIGRSKFQHLIFKDLVFIIPTSAEFIDRYKGSAITRLCEKVIELSEGTAVELTSFTEAVYIAEAPEIRIPVLIKTSHGEVVKKQLLEKAVEEVTPLANAHIKELKNLEANYGISTRRDPIQHTFTLTAIDLGIQETFHYEDAAPEQISAMVKKVKQEAEKTLERREELLQKYIDLGGKVTETTPNSRTISTPSRLDNFTLSTFGEAGFLTLQSENILNEQIRNHQARIEGLKITEQAVAALKPKLPEPAKPEPDGFWASKHPKAKPADRILQVKNSTIGNLPESAQEAKLRLYTKISAASNQTEPDKVFKSISRVIGARSTSSVAEELFNRDWISPPRYIKPSIIKVYEDRLTQYLVDANKRAEVPLNEKELKKYIKEFKDDLKTICGYMEKEIKGTVDRAAPTNPNIR